jgi:hypothetical protein
MIIQKSKKKYVNFFFNISQYLLIIIKKRNDSAIIDNKISGTADPKASENGIK